MCQNWLHLCAPIFHAYFWLSSWCYGINFLIYACMIKRVFLWDNLTLRKDCVDIKPDSLNLVWITDDEQRLEEDQEDDSEGPQPTPFNPLIFWPAALCDMTATSIQYIALTLTYASSFQMLRGKTKHFIFCMRVLSVVWFHFSDNFTACQCWRKIWKIKREGGK